MIKINSSFHSNSTESLHNTKENVRDLASICTAIEQEGRIDTHQTITPRTTRNTGEQMTLNALRNREGRCDVVHGMMS